MDLPSDAQLLRIYLKETDHCGSLPLYEAIVLKARERHIAGATVLRGPMGYGHSSRMHTAKILRLSMDLPLVIEIVDTEAKLRALAAEIRPLLSGGLMTLERVQVLHHAAAGTG